jgi:hypothetical protein
LSRVEGVASEDLIQLSQEINQQPKLDEPIALDAKAIPPFDALMPKGAHKQEEQVDVVGLIADAGLQRSENFAATNSNNRGNNRGNNQDFLSFDQESLQDTGLDTKLSDIQSNVFSFDDNTIKFNPTSNIIEIVDGANLKLVDQISMTAAYMKKIGQAQVTLKLHPQELGKISVRIVFAADHKTIQKINISAENHNTLADLKIAVEQLRLSLTAVTDIKKTELTFDLQHNFNDNHSAFFDQKGDAQQKAEQQKYGERVSLDDAIVSYDLEDHGGDSRSGSGVNIRV